MFIDRPECPWHHTTEHIVSGGVQCGKRRWLCKACKKSFTPGTTGRDPMVRDYILAKEDSIIPSGSVIETITTEKIATPCIIINDIHIPYEDDKMWQKMLRVGVELKKRFGKLNVACIGDFLDLEELSRFAKKQTGGGRIHLVDDELIVGKRRVTELMEVFDRFYYTLGNHEGRWFKQEGLGSIDLQQLLIPDALKSRVYTTTDTTIETEDGKWKLSHPKGTSDSLLKKLIINNAANIFCGHTHWWSILPHGRWIGVWGGHMCDVAKVPGRKGDLPTTQWRTNFSLIDENGHIKFFNDVTAEDAR